MVPDIDRLTNDEISKLAKQFNRRPSEVMRVFEKHKKLDTKKIFEKKSEKNKKGKK